MPRVGFEPTISAGARLYTYALDRAATGTGPEDWYLGLFMEAVDFVIVKFRS